MGFLDDFIVSARGAALDIGKRAEEVANISKLRFEMKDLEKQRASAYEKIGRLYAETLKTGKNNKEHCISIIGDIEKMNGRIKSLSDEITAQVSNADAVDDKDIRL